MPEREPVEELTLAWFSHAVDDLKVCRSLRSSVDEFRSPLAFHAQQAIEKALKAVLVAEQIDFSRTHDLVDINGSLPSGWGLDFPADRLSRISAYAIEFRYPASHDLERPELDSMEVVEAIALAETVMARVAAALRAHGIDLSGLVAAKASQSQQTSDEGPDDPEGDSGG